MDQVPFGYRFCPSEAELILHYLYPKVNGEQVPGQGRIIFDIDLYGDEPSKIWEAFKTRRENMQGEGLYFFTQLKTKAPADRRIGRETAGNGTWKGEDGGKPVKAPGTQRVIGMRRRFTYIKKKQRGSGDDGCWLMHEFGLDQSLVRNASAANKFVLCLLKENERTVKKRKQQSREEEEEEEMVYEDGVGNDQDNNSAPFLGTQEKRQRILPCADNNASPLLQPSDDLDEFVAELEQALERPCYDGIGDILDNVSCGFFGTQEERQCLLPPTINILSSKPSDDIDEFAAELEQALDPCHDEDENALQVETCLI